MGLSSRVMNRGERAASAPFEAHDASFSAVLGAAPRLIRVVPADAHEGPVYVADEDALYFTTLPRARDVPERGLSDVAIKRLALDGDRFPVGPENVSVVRAKANAANGMALDLHGRLVVCEQGSPSEHARISRLDPATGAEETVVDAWDGLAGLNRSPQHLRQD